MARIESETICILAYSFLGRNDYERTAVNYCLTTYDGKILKVSQSGIDWKPSGVALKEYVSYEELLSVVAKKDSRLYEKIKGMNESNYHQYVQIIKEHRK